MRPDCFHLMEEEFQDGGLRPGCPAEQFKLPEVKLREKETEELYMLFRSYGYTIPRRSIRFLLRRSNEPEAVDMKLFMGNTGYACCGETIEILRQAYLEWTKNRLTLAEFIRQQAEAAVPEDSQEEDQSDSDR